MFQFSDSKPSAPAVPPGSGLVWPPSEESISASSATGSTNSALDVMIANNLSPPPAPPVDHQKEKKDKPDTKGRFSACLACPDTRCNSCWCKKHKRAYDCIYNNATSTKAMLNEANPDAKQVPTACNAVDGSEYHAFIIIFGDEKERRNGFRQPVLAIKCVITFCSNHPEGVEKRKKRLFSLALTQFLHNQEVHQSHEQVSGEGKLDYEIFMNQMKTLRGMPADRANTLWEELKNDPSVDRDEKGPAWSRLRLHVPGNLLGTDREEHRKGVTERKVLSQQSKPGALGDAEIEALQTEMKKGFKRPFSGNDAIASMHSTLAPGSMTIAGGEDAQKKSTTSSVLMDAVQESMSSATAPAPAAVSGGGGAPVAGALVRMSASPQDIRLDRDKTRRTLTNDLEKSLNKMKTTIKDAVVLMGQASVNPTDDHELVSVLDERIVIGTMWLACNFDFAVKEGIELKTDHVTIMSWLDLIKVGETSFLDNVILHYFPGRASLKTETESCTMKRANIIAKLGAASKLTEAHGEPNLAAWKIKVHQVILQESLDKASLLPIDSGNMSTGSCLHNNLAQLANVTTPLEMEVIGEVAATQKVLQDQLILSIKKATSALKRVVQQRAKDAENKEKEKLTAAAQESIVQTMAEKVEATKKLRHDVTVTPHYLDYSNLGHTPVREMFSPEGDDEVEEGEFSKPFKISSSCTQLDAVKAIKAINDVVQVWEGSEQGFISAGKGNIVLTHTLSPQQGSLEFQTEMKKIFVDYDDVTFLTDVPSDNNSLMGPLTRASLFGVNGSFASRSLVSTCGLGEMRLVTKGELLVLAVDTHSLVESLKETPLDSCLIFLDGLNEQAATVLMQGSQKTNVWNTSVKAGELIYIPAGWLVRMANARPDPLSGVTMNVLPSTSLTKPLVAARDLVGMDKNVKTDIEAILNALSFTKEVNKKEGDKKEGDLFKD
jgi:hypothetical protein